MVEQRKVERSNTAGWVFTSETSRTAYAYIREEDDMSTKKAPMKESTAKQGTKNDSATAAPAHQRPVVDIGRASSARVGGPNGPVVLICRSTSRTTNSSPSLL